MPKLFFFIVFLGFIITVLIGLFLWSNYSEDMDNIMPAVKVEPPENYKFIETEEGKFIENTNVGLKFKIPEEWTAEKKEVQKDEWVINVMSPDIKFGEDGLLSEGCGFSVWVEEDEILANVIRTQLGEIADADEDSEVVEIGGYSALKINIKKESWGEIQAIEIPVRDMVIKFDTLFRPETQERCSAEFSKFLNEINIE
ncbi:hypothetical protein B6D52_02690 [Candidatus Parcubacteria bacterium 4484_255]|nr:MAG: hypothetical protein B6D52_02690 [Candidatus Parcubacteria bacterium 4484_255]